MTHFLVTIPPASIILAKGVKQPDLPLLEVQENQGHLFLPTNEQDIPMLKKTTVSTTTVVHHIGTRLSSFNTWRAKNPTTTRLTLQTYT